MKGYFGGREFDVEIYEKSGSTDDYVIRLFNGDKERYPELLSNLVIVSSCAGFLYLRFIGDDAVMSGILDRHYFSAETTEDIVSFLEERFPRLKSAYFPYHIDFAEFTGYDEYNGEY